MNGKDKKPLPTQAELAQINNNFHQYRMLLSIAMEPEDFDRVPCIRIMADGTIEYFNCKTGEIIKK